VPNFAGALKGEITRLARKEVRANVTPLKKLVAGLRRRVAQQRRQISELEKGLRKNAARAGAAVESTGGEGTQIRFSPAWVKQHRKKLKMSRRVYAKLVGVSAQSIFGWETGRTRPRRRALESWRRMRSMERRREWCTFARTRAWTSAPGSGVKPLPLGSGHRKADRTGSLRCSRRSISRRSSRRFTEPGGPRPWHIGLVLLR